MCNVQRVSVKILSTKFFEWLRMVIFLANMPCIEHKGPHYQEIAHCINLYLYLKIHLMNCKGIMLVSFVLLL